MLYMRLVRSLRSIGVVRVVNSHKIATLVYMVDTAELSVHLFQHDTLSLWDEEVNECRKQDVDTSEHVEGIEATVLRGTLDPAAIKGWDLVLP